MTGIKGIAQDPAPSAFLHTPFSPPAITPNVWQTAHKTPPFVNNQFSLSSAQLPRLLRLLLPRVIMPIYLAVETAGNKGLRRSTCEFACVCVCVLHVSRSKYPQFIYLISRYALANFQLDLAMCPPWSPQGDDHSIFARPRISCMYACVCAAQTGIARDTRKLLTLSYTEIK